MGESMATEVPIIHSSDHLCTGGKRAFRAVDIEAALASGFHEKIAVKTRELSTNRMTLSTEDMGSSDPKVVVTRNRSLPMNRVYLTGGETDRAVETQPF
jgi:hypothetical protein